MKQLSENPLKTTIYVVQLSASPSGDSAKRHVKDSTHGIICIEDKDTLHLLFSNHLEIAFDRIKNALS